MSPQDQSRPGLLKWLVTNPDTGETVLGQFPNPPLIAFLVSRGLAYIVPNDGLSQVLSAISSAALLWWAGLELFRGDAPWRRIMGGVVSLMALGSLYQAFF